MLALGTGMAVGLGCGYGVLQLLWCPTDWVLGVVLAVRGESVQTTLACLTSVVHDISFVRYVHNSYFTVY